MSVQIYRATVRGFFADLEPEVRDALLADVDAHQPMDAAFTEAGTFVYERGLAAFSFRYELRIDHDDDDERELADLAAEARALERATETLAASGIAAKGVRASVTNMATMWERKGSAR